MFKDVWWFQEVFVAMMMMTMMIMQWMIMIMMIMQMITMIMMIMQMMTMMKSATRRRSPMHTTFAATSTTEATINL